MIPVEQKNILDSLIEKGFLDASQREKIETRMGETEEFLEDILIGDKSLSEGDILAASSAVFNSLPIKASALRVEDEVLSLIPRKLAETSLVLPVSVIGDRLTVAMANPNDILALDDIRAITEMNVTVIVSTRAQMRQAVYNHYEETADSRINRIVEESDTSHMEMLDKSSDGKLSQEKILEITDDAPVVKVTNMILKNAIKERASDILIERMENSSRVRYRVDGALSERYNPPKSFHHAIISRIKVISELDIAEKRLPQDGRFTMRFEGRKIDFRVSIVPSSYGEKAALRVLDTSQAMIDLDSLGFYRKDNKRLKNAARKPYGMLVVCGPTGCGKTTTLYSILQYVDSEEKNLVTIEDPVEYARKGINQISIRPDIGLTFPSCLRSILRQDPDIIMVGEIRSFDTLDVAIKSALTGHLVLSTLHTNTAADAITRMINMGIEPFLINSSIELVAAQCLLRILCPDCCENYLPDRDTAERHGLLDHKGNVLEICRPVGCDKCRNTGYRGRVGIIETLPLSPKIKELILDRAETVELEKQARKEGMTTLRENGIRNVIEGIVSLEDVLKITVDTRRKSGE